MPKKSKIVKLFISIGIKGVLCIVCLASVAFALVTYSTAVTITPTQQLTAGVGTSAFTVYVNEVNQVRYVPGTTGGFSELTLNTGDTTTYAFKVVTDAHKVCAVKVELQSAMDGLKFSNFDVTVRSSTGGAWGTETLYDAATGTNAKASINGLTPGDAAYVHQDVSTTKYYEIQVTYSYDKVDTNTAITPTFVFTPLPQDGF